MSAFEFAGASPSDDGRPATRPIETVAVVGAGAWGTALAVIAAQAGRTVRLHARREDHAAALRRDRRNARHLPEAPFPDSILPTSDLREAVEGADAVLLVVPSGAVRETARTLAAHLAPGVPVCLAAKGVEVGTDKLMSRVVAEELPENPVAALSGPNFAGEAATGHPTAATIASAGDFGAGAEATVAVRLAVALGTESFRPYVSDDLVGVEIGGALKNVIAIACGIAVGAGFGENTRAALITRGLDEMKRLAEPLGGRRETVTGLAGIGDLALTCSSPTSRNMRLGLELGQGRKRADCFDGEPVVVEGERNALSVTDLARAHGVDLPICESVRAILHDGASIAQTFAALWARPLEGEPKALSLSLAHPAAAKAAGHFKERMR
ncbi:MAG: NAD(P)H-dependent glycerol-3-phosphate dehydrogenase [Paracoccaceae bacterium]